MSGNWKQTGLPCPDTENCGSSDAYAIDNDDKGFCFSCRKLFNSDGSLDTSDLDNIPSKTLQEMVTGGIHTELTKRGISKKAAEFFDIKIIDGRYVFSYPSREDGSIVAQKLRPVDVKEFYWKGEPKRAGLFGMNKFKSGNAITIVGGEFDAAAFYDMMGEYPVVSVKNGENNTRDISEMITEGYFNNFSKVYICLDNDKTGLEWAPKIADLFPIGKVKIVTLRHFKDPNEYLQNKRIKEFKDCWWQAVDYTPAGIEAANTGGFDSLFEEIDGLELFPYPYDGLNESTFGIRKNEMVTVVAGSGVGKSAFIGEVAYKLHTETDRKIGMLMLEESPKKTKLRMMSMYLNKPLHLTLLGRVAEKFSFLKTVLERLFTSKEDYEWSEKTKKQLKQAWDAIIEKRAKDGEQQLWFFNHFGSNDTDTIVSRIDAMVTGLGCEFIFLDHISIVVSDQANGDERKALDELATKLRTLVERRNFALIIVSHLRRPGGKPHEEGGETSLADIRGTAGIGQLSDIVIGLERNGQADSEFMRNVTKIRVLKNRFAGFTGLASYAHYDIKNGRLEEISEEEVKEHETGEQSNDFTRIPDDMPVFDTTTTGTNS